MVGRRAVAVQMQWRKGWGMGHWSWTRGIKALEVGTWHTGCATGRCTLTHTPPPASAHQEDCEHPRPPVKFTGGAGAVRNQYIR